MSKQAVLSLAAVVALALAGCATRAASGSKSKINPRMLQEDLMSFDDRFSTTIADAYDQAAESVTSPQTKDFALNCKIENSSAASSCAVDDNPVAGLLDMLVMTSLTRASAEAPWFKEMFGDSAARIAAVHRREEEEIWQIATRYLSAAQLAELRAYIDRWLGEHPDQRHVAMVRLSDFSRVKGAMDSAKAKPGSVFGLLFLDPMAGLDPAVREVEQSREMAQRMFYYFRRMPVLIAWQGELSTRRIVEQAAQETAATVATEREAAIKQVSATVATEREAAIKQVSATVATERDAAIQQTAATVATERDATIKQVSAAVAAERQAVIAEATTRASAEGNAVIQHVGAVLQSERTALFHDVDATAKGLIDRILWGQIIVVLIGVAIVVVGALVYRRLRPR